MVHHPILETCCIFAILFIPCFVYLVWPYDIGYRYYVTDIGVGMEPIGMWNTFLNVGYIQKQILGGICRFWIAMGLFVWTVLTSFF